MDPYFLLKDELEFELACRGIHDIKTCIPMRKILKEILNKDLEGKTPIKLTVPRACLETPLTEIVTCENKFMTLSAALDEIQDNPDQTTLRRIRSRLEHLNNRIGFIVPTEETLIERHLAIRNNIRQLVATVENTSAVEDIEDKEGLSEQIKEILQKSIGDEARNIIEKIEGMSVCQDEPVPSTSQEPSETKSQKVQVIVRDEVIIPTAPQGRSNMAGIRYTDNYDRPDDCDQVSKSLNDRRQTFTRSSTIDFTSSKRKLVPVKDWGVKFSGRGNLSINAFLERVEELKEARNAEDEDLFRYAIDLFEDEALIWFRANRNLVASWNDLVDLMLVTFQQPFYQEELLDEIRGRTQSSQESVSIYIATMQNMFNRLPTKLTEHQKLAILLKNIHPYFQRAICRENFKTVSELTTVLRILEHTKINCENFREPSNNPRSLEPDLAFRGNTNNVYAINNFNRNINQQDPNTTMKCWNCRYTGHRFRECNIPRQRMFCFKCGQFGVTTINCNCSNTRFSGNEKPEEMPANPLPKS